MACTNEMWKHFKIINWKECIQIKKNLSYD